MSEVFNLGSEADELRSGFSVVVCTHNRAPFLSGTLDSVLAQHYPKDGYEIIVVDNNSIDGTQDLVKRYLTGASVQVSYYLEPRAGASFARNLGIAKACREYVALLDDDTVAAPGWLAGFDAAIRRYSAVAGGGPVEPVIEPGVEPPIWWDDRNIRGIFGLDHAHLHSSKEIVAIRWPLWLGAGNSFYSKRLLRRHGGFRTDCGPVGQRYRVAHDVELNVRLERAGVPIYYVRDSRIKHRITADQLTYRYIWRRAYAAGTTDAHACTVLGKRSNAGRLLPLARAVLRLLVSRKLRRMSVGCRVAYGLGYTRKHWVMMLSRKIACQK
jgi:glycosyltransferase involved in cell wall biosynthesis